ncbi:hypothetical protein FRC01_005183, partial [Tulasnella sp. 417]
MALRFWRKKGAKELAKLIHEIYPEAPEKLVAACESSISARNEVTSGIDSACLQVLQLIPLSGSPNEWNILLTWLALLLDPITVRPSQKSLEKSFIKASRGGGDHPMLKDPVLKRRAQYFDEMKAN